MTNQNRRKVIWWSVCGFLITVLTFVLWPSNPCWILAAAPYLERKGEENGQWLRDKLIACGPRAIQPTIEAIAEHSPWVRVYCILPQVLRHFGEPARSELVAAIDKEPDSKRRAYLISSLQSGFNDFSRLEIALSDLNNRPSRWSLTHLAADVRESYPEAPDLADSTGINSAFLVWWRANKPSPK